MSGLDLSGYENPIDRFLKSKLTSKSSNQQTKPDTDS